MSKKHAPEDLSPQIDDVSADGTAVPQKPLKLDYGQTFKVGFAFAIIMLFWTAYDFVIPLLLEHAYGLSNAVRGLIMGLDNLLSLFMLPLFGKLSDNSHGKLAKKWGRRTPFIVIGTIVSAVLMIFVPVVTLNQQEKAMAIEANIEAQLNDDAFMNETLNMFWNSGDKNLCDTGYVTGESTVGGKGSGITKEQYLAIRFDENFKSTKAFLGMLGEETYSYNGNDVALTDAVPAEIAAGVYDWNGDGAKTYADIKQGNDYYSRYVEAGMNTYMSNLVYEQATNTKAGHTSLAVYMVILLLVLIAMGTFRSPAVALMPDVTPKPIRSQGNAVINLCGGVGGAIAFLIYTVVLFGERLENYVIIFGSVAAGMLLLLAGFLALVREKKMVERCREICREYGIEDEEEDTAAIAVSADESVVDCDTAMTTHHEAIADGETDADAARASVLEVAKAKLRKMPSPKEWWGAKTQEEKARFRSFLLILASIFMWFMGYNAVSSNLSIYTTKALSLDAGVASIISGVSMGFSAIAFIPVGYMAAKLGRRKTIMIGLAMAVVAFVLIFAFVEPNENAVIPAVLFALFYLISGFGLIIINVNTLPMVVELSTESTVGQYTGYYYVATMSAQAITPAFAGLVMDNISNRGLFIYGAIFVALAIVFMIFVKHGDSKPVGAGRKLSKEEKKQIRLDALDSAD